MKRFIVFFIVFVCMIFSYVNKEKSNVVLNEDSEIKKEEFNVNVSYNDEVINLELEEYVIGVVACEMPASFDDEALKAMSVAARTFALYKLENNINYKLKSDTSDQCYISLSEMKDKWGNNFDKYYNKIKNIVYETKNEYMVYNDEVIISFYFSISNGYTENVENVFSQKLDYLVSVDSSWDKNSNYKSKDLKIKINDFFNKLGIDYSNNINIKYERSDTGRVNYLYINGNKFKGTKIRTLLSLRSTDFEISNDKEYVYIKTKGYGHGVGMSQYGANYMAKSGYKYDEILKHYYTDVEIVNKI